jgi:AAA family ATP:ADP antiporter
VVTAKDRFAAILPAERTAVAWAFLYFFAILCGYYMLRPLRDEMGIVGGVKNLSWLFTATFVVMLVAVPFYSAVVARFPRRTIIPIVYRFCALNLLAFLVLDRADVSEVWLARVFFVWVSVFNLFVVSIFWSFLVDTFREEQGKRLFGAIAAGGSLGAIAGPAIAAVLVKPLGRTGLFVAAALLLEVAVFCVKRLIAWAEANRSGGFGAAPDRPVGGGAFAGFRLALRSPYLLAIAGMMLAYTLTSTVIYADQARIVEATIKDSATRTALFARIDLWVNIVALTLQGFVTSRVLSLAGLGAALLALPFLTAGGFIGLALVPGLATLVVVQIARRGLQYGMERPSREVLFTVVSSEEKYKAKAFIDTVVFRGGDAASIWAYDAVRSVSPSTAVVTAGMLCVCAGWAATAWFASRRNAALAAAGRGV